jgi:methionine synthase II (cobalamin-independent)
MTDAQFRTMQAAVLEQEIAGIDIITSGEAHRRTHNIETGALIAERIRAHSWLAPDRTVITSTCGFNHLPRHIALGKMRAMAEAKAILGGTSA